MSVGCQTAAPALADDINVKGTASVAVVEVVGSAEESDSTAREDIPTNNEVDITSFDPKVTHLISSPYPALANQLRLHSLDISSRLFALALSVVQPTRLDYATAPYLDSFDWPVVFATLRALCRRSRFHWHRQEFYLVTFRSKRRGDADVAKMALLDQKSHEEACASGGLLKYWFGSVDEEMRNLATCIWRNREDAAAGGKGPWHRQARGAARELYDYINFETYRFVVEDGAEVWRIEEYDER